MSILLSLFTIILLTVYVFSDIAICGVFVDNNISASLWSVLVILLPIVNTIFVIKYNKKILNYFSIKTFLKEIKNIK